MSADPEMVPFAQRFPDLGLRETRGIINKPGSPVLPVGTFGFVELFCADPACDCRRVRLEVRSNDPPHERFATIIWGWEMSDYYLPWTKDLYAAELHVAGYLDPAFSQSEHAEDFLGMFRHFVCDDASDWPERFARHYDMFKATLGVPPPGSAPGQVRCIKAGRENYPPDEHDQWRRSS